MSLVVIVMTLIYASSQMIQLVIKADPEIVTYTKNGGFDAYELLNLKENNIRFAFHVWNTVDLLP